MTDPELHYPKAQVTGGILAGGLARRLGGVDKGLVTIHGRPMIEFVTNRLSTQVGSVIINANRNTEAYQAYAETVVADAIEGHQGPLAGMATVLRAATTQWVLFVPCDSPLLPSDLGPKLYRAIGRDADGAVVSLQGRLQPVFVLLNASLAESIEQFLRAGERKIDHWFARHHIAPVDFDDDESQFVNINDETERLALERSLAAQTL